MRRELNSRAGGDLNRDFRKLHLDFRVEDGELDF